VEFALRSQPMFRSIADKRPAQQAMPGSSVVFELYSDLAVATGTLTEATDVDAVAIANPTTVTVTLAEYGSAVLNTRKLELFSLSNVKPAIANIVAFNMLNSVDSVVLTELRQGTNVIREIAGAISTAAITGITSTDTFKSKHVRYCVAKLRTASAVPRKGELYWCGIHPEVSHDLRAETGAAAWRDPHNYQSADQIWAGEIGQYEGAFFVESPRNYNAVDGGAGGNTVRTFRTLFAGEQALAEAVAEEFNVVVGNVVDKLKRFTPIGWYGVAGWKRYREASLYRVETTSSIDGS
jgi:N4-gp56 family major capsid protein